MDTFPYFRPLSPPQPEWTPPAADLISLPYQLICVLVQPIYRSFPFILRLPPSTPNWHLLASGRIFLADFCVKYFISDIALVRN